MQKGLSCNPFTETFDLCLLSGSFAWKYKLQYKEERSLDGDENCLEFCSALPENSTADIDKMENFSAPILLYTSKKSWLCLVKELEGKKG